MSFFQFSPQTLIFDVENQLKTLREQLNPLTTKLQGNINRITELGQIIQETPLALSPPSGSRKDGPQFPIKREYVNRIAFPISTFNLNVEQFELQKTIIPIQNTISSLQEQITELLKTKGLLEKEAEIRQPIKIIDTSSIIPQSQVSPVANTTTTQKSLLGPLALLGIGVLILS